jgi:hypothetical protein
MTGSKRLTTGPVELCVNAVRLRGLHSMTLTVTTCWNRCGKQHTVVSFAVPQSIFNGALSWQFLSRGFSSQPFEVWARQASLHGSKVCLTWFQLFFRVFIV